MIKLATWVRDEVKMVTFIKTSEMKKLFLFLLSFLGTITFAQTPVAYYDFNFNIKDISGNNHHGEVFNFELSNFNEFYLGNNQSGYATIPPNVVTGLTDFTIYLKLSFDEIHNSRN